MPVKNCLFMKMIKMIDGLLMSEINDIDVIEA